jgi:hypothetical protein
MAILSAEEKDELLDGIRELRQFAAGHVESEKAIKEKVDKHDEFINGNGVPGAKVQLSSLRGRINMVFGILGGVWTISTIILASRLK